MSIDRERNHRAMASRLETARLLLQPFDPMDAERYAELIGERGPGARGFGTTTEGARQNIARMAQEAQDNGIGFLAIRRRMEGDLIGYCGLFVGRASLDEPEIAYELFRRAHGRGYATEAAVALIAEAAETGRHRLWSTVGIWNYPSFRVLQKAGFRRDHVETDSNGADVVYLVRDL